MSIEKAKRHEKIRFFAEKAKGCITDHQKIEFFDSTREAFFTDSKTSIFSVKENIPIELDDAFYVYANMKKLDEKELENLKNLSWTEYPEVLKIFLFDFCIFNGDAYSKFFLNSKRFF